MNTHSLIWIGYVSFILLLLAGLHWMLREHAPLDRRWRVATVAGLAGFVAHAVIFFSDPILFVDLGFIACAVGEILFWSSPARKA